MYVIKKFFLGVKFNGSIYSCTFGLTLVLEVRARKIQSGEEKVLTDNRYRDQEKDRGGVRNIIILLRINWRWRYISGMPIHNQCCVDTF